MDLIKMNEIIITILIIICLPLGIRLLTCLFPPCSSFGPWLHQIVQVDDDNIVCATCGVKWFAKSKYLPIVADGDERKAIINWERVNH